MTSPSDDIPARIEALFTRSDGGFRFARWGRPLAPVVYGTDDEGVAIFERGLGTVAGIAGLPVQDLDEELGANFMVFFCRDWAELLAVPHLAKLIPDLERLVTTLSGAGANQYRIFGFDEAGAIRIAITLIRYDETMQQVSAQTLALGQSLQGMLLWSDQAFTEESPLAIAGEGGAAVVKPFFGALLAAAYDPAMPAASQDAATALRLSARVGLALAEGGGDA